MNNGAPIVAPTSRENTLFMRGWALCLIFCLIPAALLPLFNQADTQPYSYAIGGWIRSVRGMFLSLTENDSRAWILYPAVLMLAFSATLRLLFQRPPDWVRLPVGLIFLALQVNYLTFRLLGDAES